MEEIISGWNYDRILSQRQSEVKEAYRKQEESKKEIRKKISVLNRGLKRKELLDKIETSEENAKEILKDSRELLKRDNVQFSRQKREDFERAHPVLLGPATLDSLVEHVPEKLDYIKEGKFPFDNIFFEFMEPIEDFDTFNPTIICESALQGSPKFCGIQLIKDRVLSERHEGAYSILSFHNSDEHNNYISSEFTVSNDSQSLIGGLIRVPTLENTFVMNFKRSIDSFGNLGKLILGLDFETYPHLSSVGEGEDIMSHYKDDADRIEEYFSKLNNLAINIINYINAQNVRVVPAKRKVQTRKLRDSRRSGRKAIHESEKPFHIVKIDSGIEEINEEKDSNWSLQHRVYVIGHDRRYRDERGSIRKTIWIEPHVRGPENAPWRHHRYAVLAGMLEREKEMIRNYLPKERIECQVA